MRGIDPTADPLETLRVLGGYYECPKDAEGKRLGPLVGYAGKDNQGRQLVGDIYANFAKAEQIVPLLDLWAEQLPEGLGGANVCVGMPMGGILFAASVARAHDCRVAFAEKKITALATPDKREQSKLVFGRHDLESGDEVAIIEDVVNNLSTTEEALHVVGAQGARVVAIVCILNRSGLQVYPPKDGSAAIPIIARVSRQFPQYLQDDVEVAEDIRQGKVVWKPKNEWDRLPGAIR